MTLEQSRCAEQGHGFIGHIRFEHSLREIGVCEYCRMIWGLSINTQPIGMSVQKLRLIQDIAPKGDSK